MHELVSCSVNNRFRVGIFSLDKRLNPFSTVVLKIRSTLANVDRLGQSKKVESKKW